ncbi:phage portal protein [Bacillus cereus]|uniref:phage portal protein n=2 Tax=Bacillus thuringiensis TaxID=1428 RepID=UPI000A3D1979|nr:phage portal protein [Bacillus thuringiensis]MEB8989585.1 phage portal protein [Bacillus cereus]MEB9178816.1 phage portal protein [Bacillus cereus]MED2575266.1 phage portal protein [Bacillus thuringiensis]OTZ91114.1 phage portal protein [Bacillus thuringiensis serovar darmstadiensis]
MGVRNILKSFLGKSDNGTIPDHDCENIVLKAEVAYKKLYVNAAIDLIARSLVACDFESYRSGKLKRSLNYYQLNVAPNKNENAHEFWYKVVYQLVYENEALILPIGEEMWVAESFHRETTNGFNEYVYKNVSINNHLLTKEFKEQNVLYLKLSEESINTVIDSLYSSYGLLLAKAISDYKGNGRLRYFVKGRFMNSLTDENGKAAQKLFEEKMKDYTNPEKLASVLFLPDNVTLEDQSKDPRNLDTRDIKNLAKDMLEFVATAFHIPPSLLSGISEGGISTTGNPTGDLDNFIVFAVRPIGEMIVNEYNKKRFSRDQYLNKTYIKFNMDNFKLFDLTKFANSVDKLFAVGGMSINDVLERLGKESIKEDWADERYVTKNYERARISGTMRGGDNDANGKDSTEISNDGQ